MRIVLLLTFWASAKFLQGYVPTADEDKSCFEQKNAYACENFAQGFSLQDKNQIKLRIRYSLKACELGIEQSCGELYDLAKQINSAEVQRVEKLLEMKCTNLSEACGFIAEIYIDQKKYSKLLSFSKEAWIKKKNRFYPLYEFKYGKKDVAFKTALETCEDDTNECVIFLKAMSSHPQKVRLLELSELACQNEKPDSYGKLCEELGVYFVAKGKTQKAIEVFESSCKHRGTISCLVLIALQNNKTKMNLAYQTYCEHVLSFSLQNESIERSCSRDKEKNKEVTEFAKSQSRFTLDQLRKQVAP